MEIKNLLHTEKVITRDRTYYLDLKKAENDNNYLVITQRKETSEGEYERVKMILFEEDLKKFGDSFLKILFNFQSANKPNGRLSDEEIEELRKIYPRAYEPWVPEDDDQLRIMVQEGNTIEKMSSFFQRKESAVLARMGKLNLPIEEFV